MFNFYVVLAGQDKVSDTQAQIQSPIITSKLYTNCTISRKHGF